MSSPRNNPQDKSNPVDRRASFSAGSSLSEFFNANRQPQPPPAYPGPITSAAAQANHRRRMSVSAISGTSPPQLQTSFSLRRGSVSSNSSSASTVDECAIDETEGPASASPTSPFARRMSWGAKMRDIRLPNTSRVPQSPAASPNVARSFWPDSSLKKNGDISPTDPSLQQRRQSMPAPPSGAMPIPTTKKRSADPFQERMLRNDFYMD